MSLPTREEAYALLCEWVQSESLRRHMLAVEAALRAYARHYGQDEELWGITGLLHDLDYERYPDMDDPVNGHPRAALRLFRERNYPAELIHAVEAHATFLGVPRESLLDKALLACDELTGLILAAAYVRPDRDLRNVELKSIKKKWKDKAFTAAIDRQENMHFIEELGVPFDEHVQRVLTAMQGIAEKLGVAGPGSHVQPDSAT
ncbi:MAG: HDIG domain-containing protein [Caldilinea sp.]|nr:HDIG domain-containing protein [Caldilinea sp.]MDW8439479.1 HDIG domain-containing protein [Caldilineaceae bacterium]